MQGFNTPGLYAADQDPSSVPSHWGATDGDYSANSGPKKRVLVVDDEMLIADTLTEILNDSGFEAITAYTAEAAMQLEQGFRPDILMSDVLMPLTDGVELAISMRAAYPGTKILLFSGQPATGTIIEDARKQGHEFEVLAKPVLPEQLIEKLKSL